MTDTPSMETQVTEHVEHFMRNLLDAGMSFELIVEHGYSYARECYGHYVREHQDRYPFMEEASLQASGILLKVARKLQIDRQSAQEQWRAHLTQEAEKA